MDTLANYRGNKSVKGLYQFIINRIPECNQFIELFAGSAAIARKIAVPDHTVKTNCNSSHSECIPVKSNCSGSLLTMPVATVLNDCNTGTTDALRKLFTATTVITNYTAAQLLITLLPGNTDTFIYCDPPYILNTRGSAKRIYEYEMSDDDHAHFLSLVRTAAFNCMISHYECEVYDTLLSGWTKEKFKVSYHGKVVNECIYYNYPKPGKLLTYKYVGLDCWDRQRVTRKIDRLFKKLMSLPEIERNAIMSRINNRLT